MCKIISCKEIIKEKEFKLNNTDYSGFKPKLKFTNFFIIKRNIKQKCFRVSRSHKIIITNVIKNVIFFNVFMLLLTFNFFNDRVLIGNDTIPIKLTITHVIKASSCPIKLFTNNSEMRRKC